jgi:L-asparaginase II
MDEGRSGPARVLDTRAGIVECEHRVRVAIWRDGALAHAAGDVDTPVCLRSAAKPVQAMASILTGAAERFAMSDAEVALACGSHSGEPHHVETAKGLLARIGLRPDHLQCGAHPPIHEPSARALWMDGGHTALHNNCSGKHSAMLAAAVAAGWSTHDYLDPAHPLQRMNRVNVAAFAGLAPDEVAVGVDGCSAPVFALPLAGAARIFAGLTNRNGVPGLDEGHRVAARRVCAAVRERPEMVGGTGRVDSSVIRVTGGRVVSKVGAEGLWCIGVCGANLGMAVKCEDGSGPSAYWVGLAVLRTLGGLDDAEWDALAEHHDLRRRNHRAIVVGHTDIYLPGDIA